MDTLVVQPYDWEIEDKVLMDDTTNHVNIHAWCLDRDSNPYLIRFPTFFAFCNVELPRFVGGREYNWQRNYNFVVDHLAKAMKDKAAVKSHFEFKPKIYYYRPDFNQSRNGHKAIQKYPMLTLAFNNVEDMYACQRLLDKPLRIDGIPQGVVFCKMWENQINLVRKLLTLRNGFFAGWIRIAGQLVPESDRISTLDREYICPWQSLQPIPEAESASWVTHPRMLCFDIEVYSDNHKAMPNKLNAKHIAYMISCIYQQRARPETRKRYLLVLGDCDDIDGSEVIRVSTERELCAQMARLVRELDPEIISGYNILGFDYPYLDARLSRRAESWEQMGRIRNDKPVLKTKTWQSGAYGIQDINTLVMKGRISIDMLPVVRRDHKLPKYDLNTVGYEFLGRGKHDVKAAEMFRITERLMTATTNINRISAWLPDVDVNAVKAAPLDFVMDLCADADYYIQVCRTLTGSGAYEQAILNHSMNMTSSWSDVLTDTDPWSTTMRPYVEGIRQGQLSQALDTIIQYAHAKADMTRVAAYCIEDSELVVDLFEKLNTWIGLIELSNIMGVTIVDLLTRGEQIRCLSQIYDLASKLGYVVDGRAVSDLKFKGGYVHPPIPGIDDFVSCLDFKSLYPSIIQACNICYTTLVPPEYDLPHKDTGRKIIPDDWCHIIEWDELVDDPSADPDGPEGRDDMVAETEDDADVSTEAPRATPKAAPKAIARHYRFRFIKASIQRGILPQLVAHLVQSRNQVRAMMKGVTDPVMETVLEQRQLALKRSANSIFGFLGVSNGKLSLPEAAMSITAEGRRLNEFCQKHLTTNYNATIVYGDSVTASTPLHVRTVDDTGVAVAGSQRYLSMQRVADMVMTTSATSTTPTTSTEGKIRVDTSNLGIQVWSDQGWTNIQQIIRHKTTKRLYRVVTTTGMVEVTEDHSLLNAHGLEITPKDVCVGMELLHAHLPPPAHSYTRQDGTDGRDVDLAVMFARLTALGQQPYVTVDESGQVHVTYNTDNTAVTNANTITHIVDMGPCTDYVYDLETANHHFAAGIGRMVVHNTDSIMFTMPQAKTTREAIEWGRKMEKEINTLFPKPLQVELEKVGRMFRLKKKKYAFWQYDWKSGELAYKLHPVTKEVTTERDILMRGIILARRDNCKWQREVYNDVLNSIISMTAMDTTFNLIVDAMLNFMHGQVPWHKLQIIRGLGSAYKSETYFMKIFADELRRIGKPANAGDRLEYVIVKGQDEVAGEKLGYKMRLSETYLERLGTDEAERIDIEYYLEKVIANCVEQLFAMGYAKELQERQVYYKRLDQQRLLCEVMRQVPALAEYVPAKYMEILAAKAPGVAVDDAATETLAEVEEELIDHLLTLRGMKTRMTKLKSHFLGRRSVLSTRMDDKPIVMMLKIMRARKNVLTELVARTPQVDAVIGDDMLLPTAVADNGATTTSTTSCTHGSRRSVTAPAMRPRLELVEITHIPSAH